MPFVTASTLESVGVSITCKCLGMEAPLGVFHEETCKKKYPGSFATSMAELA